MFVFDRPYCFEFEIGCIPVYRHDVHFGIYQSYWRNLSLFEKHPDLEYDQNAGKYVFRGYVLMERPVFELSSMTSDDVRSFVASVLGVRTIYSGICSTIDIPTAISKYEGIEYHSNRRYNSKCPLCISL